MSRKKKVVIPTVTRDEAEQAMAVFARNETRLKTIETAMESQKQKIGEQYMEEIVTLKKDQEIRFEILHSFALTHRDAWEGKSLDLLQGRIGFRTGNKKVVKDKRYSWEAITDFVKAKFPKLVRVSYELNKEAVLKLDGGNRLKKLKDTCFVDVVQEESFFAEASGEELTAA